MIINHKYRFIFVRTRKTASTSLEIGLSKFCGPHDVITRVREEEEALRSKLGYPGRQNDLVPFRNYRFGDWKRLIRGRGLRRFSPHSPATFIRDHIDPSIWESYFKFCFVRNPFDRIVSEYYFYTGRLGKTMSLAEFLDSAQTFKLSNFPVYSSGDEVIVDYVARYENLTQELETISERIGINETIELPRAKAGFRKTAKPVPEVIDPESKRRIEEACRREIDLFGYSMEELISKPA
jgi:hypothetical protein